MYVLDFVFVSVQTCVGGCLCLCVRVSVGSVFKCLQGASKQEKHTNNKFLIAFLE